LALSAGGEIESLGRPHDPKPVRLPLRRVGLAAELKLDEVAPARPEVRSHPLEVAAELLGREVRERVDRAERAVEGAAQVEVGHVRYDHVQPARAGELDHRR
jgi:hypothetical protein